MDLELFSFACELAGLGNAMFTPRRPLSQYDFLSAEGKLADFPDGHSRAKGGEHTNPTG